MKHLIRIIFIGLIFFTSNPLLYVQTNFKQVGSMHSFSVSTPYRLEYSYEYAWDSGMSLIGRIGAGSEAYSPHKNNYDWTNGFRLTIEP